MGLIQVGPCDADTHVARAQWVPDRGLRAQSGRNVRMKRARDAWQHVRWATSSARGVSRVA